MDLSNQTSLGLLLLRGGSDADERATEFTAGRFGSSTGLIESYYFRYTFPDQVPLTGLVIKTIYSSYESMSRLVKVSYF